MSARPESYSNMPTSKMPTTVNCLSRGRMPAGATRPCGAISVTLSPALAPRARASSAARANFLLDPVHHREHHEQRGDAERDAEHRGERDEGDEGIAALGARVAQPDEEFVLHARKCAITGDKLEIGCTSICIFPISSPPREFHPPRASPPRRR